MGLDVGDSTIGIAMSDALLITSQGLENYKRVTKAKDIAHLINLINEYDVSKVIIGLPLNLDDTLGEQALKTQAFAKSLMKKIKYSDKINKIVEIEFEDERYTSIEAQEFLKSMNVSSRKISKVIDKMAAQIILKTYMDKISSEVYYE